MTNSEKLKYKFQTANVVEKLIAINVLVFILFFLTTTILYLFQINSEGLLDYFVFPKDIGEYVVKPWTIITYSFFHSGFLHILGNMLILYYAGTYFLTYFQPKRLLTYYFLGVIMGALIFMLSYNLFPAFQGGGRSSLIGASAGVMAVLIGVATYIPEMRIRLILIGPIKFWYIAAALVAIDIIQIPFGNAGGHLAHLGGAALGYFYTKQLQKGNDIGAGFERAIDWFISLFSARKREQPKMRTVYKKTPSGNQTSKPADKFSKTEKQQKIDTILDKISKSGYDSLSKQEKDFLFHAGKEN